MKLSQLLNATPSLQYVSQLNLPPIKSFRVAGWLKKAQAHADAWTTVNTTLSQKHADDQGQFKSEEDAKAYHEAVAQVLEEPLDLEPQMILSYPADFAQVDKVVPAHIAVLSDLFVECQPGGMLKTYEINRFEILHSMAAMNQIAQSALPKAAASTLIDNQVALLAYAKDWDAKEVGMTEDERTAFRNEKVEVQFYPIKISEFETELSPSLLFQLYWLLEE